MATNAELRHKVHRLKDQCTGVKLLAKEIDEQMDTIRFTLVANDFKSRDVDLAVNKIMAITALMSTAGDGI